MPSSTNLKSKQEIELTPAAPFCFDATLHKPDHFPSADNTWEPGTRWQTMRYRGLPLGLKFEDRGDVDQPKIALSIYSKEKLETEILGSLLAEIQYRYNFQLDLGEFNQRFEGDPKLGPLITRWKGMKPLNCSSLYEYLMIAIVLQNATVRRSVNMMQVLLEKYGIQVSYDLVVVHSLYFHLFCLDESVFCQQP